MSDDGERLSEDEAERVWKIAADLQAAAAEPRLPARALPAESRQLAGYSALQVREAAAEVGIAPEFVAMALAEVAEADPGPRDRIDRWAARLSGPGPRSLVVSRRLDAPIQDVHAAVRRIFPKHHLTLVDSRGEPPEDCHLVFALPSIGAGNVDPILADLTTRARVEEIHLRLLPLDQGSCIVTVSAPLGAARRAHVGIGAALTAGAGVVGGYAVSALSAAIVIPMTLGIAAEAAVVGGAMLVGLVTGGRLGIAASRAAHRAARGRGTTALERLLQTIAVELRGLTPETAPITPASDDRGTGIPSAN